MNTPWLDFQAEYGHTIGLEHNISLKDDAKLVMSGSKKQSINMYSPTIAYLINNNDKEA